MTEQLHEQLETVEPAVLITDITDDEKLPTYHEEVFTGEFERRGRAKLPDKQRAATEQATFTTIQTLVRTNSQHLYT